VFAWLTIRTGGLEAGIALHVLNNVGVFLLDAATGRGDIWITQLNAEVSYAATVLDASTNLLFGAIITRVYARSQNRA
jgi:hypothetical protein